MVWYFELVCLCWSIIFLWILLLWSFCCFCCCYFCFLFLLMIRIMINVYLIINVWWRVGWWFILLFRFVISCIMMVFFCCCGKRFIMSVCWRICWGWRIIWWCRRLGVFVNWSCRIDLVRRGVKVVSGVFDGIGRMLLGKLV